MPALPNLRQAALKIATLNVVEAQVNGPSVGGFCRLEVAGASQEDGPSGRQEMVVAELTAGLDRSDQPEATVRAECHADGRSSVQLDDRTWLEPEQLRVEQHDLRPIRELRRR